MKAMHRRLLVLAAAVLLLVSVMGMTVLAAQTETADEPVCYEHGDVNGDGEIDSRDAIRTLFYVLWGNSISVNQDCDFNGDEDLTQKDAIYLLYVSLGMYERKGTIHNYYDPMWTWDTTGDTPTVQVSLKCACGEPHPITGSIAITAGTVVDATCVSAGSKEYTAKVTCDGTEFENTYVQILPATGNGHSISALPTCKAGVKCQNCDYIQPALDHSYALNGEKVEKTGDCEKHTKLYKCSGCDKEIAGTAEDDVYYVHAYTAELKEEATCTKAGLKLLTCACGDTKEETVAINPDFHVWDDGKEQGTVTTYTCACGQTKTAVKMAENGVSADTLKENEVELEGGTTVALDEKTAEQLDADKAIVIKVEEVAKDDTNLSAAEKAQVGNSKIYDFTMLSGGERVTDFAGEVTVALPYVPQAGDDVNAIDVWYIADDGSVECVKGVYSNGYVTFKTNHFSYYTVTRLTPAQRCAVYGHVNVTQTKAATCTEDGYTKVFCQRCGEVDKEDKALALDHNYEQSAEKSVAATCAAPGKTVSVCTRCQSEKEMDVKQLTHDWELTEKVEPDCTSKGYTQYVCKLCQDEKTENEQEAKGHNWQVAADGWAWSEDNSTAAVTLVCANKNTHTKVLTAVITKNQDGSVCTGGQITYTATASYNKVPYTDTVTDTQAAVGHKPGSKWETSDSQHYHLCTVCGEKVGTANHDWEQTVTQAATCDKAGKATDKCTVCDLEKEAILPATGEHNFVNGVCSVCGYTEGNCDHKRLNEVRYDLSQYGACEGTVTVRSCECGKVTKLYNTDLSCDFKQTNSNDEKNGYYCWINTCQVCGLVAQDEEYQEIDREACTYRWILNYQFTKGDSEILKVEQAYDLGSHPVVVVHDPVNLADYGLCGGTLTQQTCPCGARSYWDINSGCYWANIGDTNESVCSVCGTLNKVVSGSSVEGCEYVTTNDTSYWRDGQEVFSYTERFVYESHRYEATSWEQYGQTCEDGVYISLACSGCGKTQGSYYDWCTTCVTTQVIDTAGTGFCSDAIEVLSCPCGAAVSYTFQFAEDAMAHEWGSYISDPATGTEYSTCMLCGYKRAVQTTYGEKDEDCRVAERNQVTFTDDKGHSFAVTTKSWNYQHKMTYTFVLKGESCEDGVKVKQVCADCAESQTYTIETHDTFPLEVLDLSAYGFCCRTVTLEACPCGQNIDIIEAGDCNWTWIDGGMLDNGGQFTMRQCTDCGNIWRQESVRAENDDPCKRVYHNTHSYLKGGLVVGTISYDAVEQNHRYVYEMKLNDGAVDCTGGYSYTATCLICGRTSSADGIFGHGMRVVARETVSTEDMCGLLEKLTYRCACGEKSSTGIQWGDDSCYFSEGNYDQTLGGRLYTCDTCGSYFVDQETTVPVAGTTCQYMDITITTYYNKAGQELVVVGSSYKWYNHDWIYRFTLLGETCDDGWTRSQVCADCGEVSDNDGDIWYGCDTYLVERTVAYENDAICGPVYLYHYACACGAVESYDVNYTCQGSWNGHYFTCDTCGMQQTNVYNYERIYGTCRQTVHMTYTFLLDGETLTTVEKTWEEAEHLTVYSYQLLGESCEDGYTYTQKCAYCDYSGTSGSIYYDHSTRRVAYYDLPEGSCEGDAEVYACACGQKRQVEYSHANSFVGTSWDETDENGIVHHYFDMACEQCGMTMEEEWYLTAGVDACHPVEHVQYTWTLGDWELTLSGDSSTTEHDYETVSLVLMPGATNCEDGVAKIQRCVTCGLENTYNTYGHEEMAVESIDLAQYGSVCGGKLEHMKCACGAYQGYEFSEDTQCDLDRKEIDHWIEGVLYEQFYTTQGWQGAYSDSYQYTCAVTDPACGMQIRMADYWLNENCTAVRYETWQLGYDAATGTCLKEITVATGDSYGYHPYKSATFNETVDGLSVTGTKFTCPDCGSYYSELSYCDDTGYQTKFVRESVNTLQNGENQKRTELWERMYYKGYQYTSLQRDEYVRADGITYWEQYAYTYDFTDGCYRTEVYTDSTGGYKTGNGETGHKTSYSEEWVKRPTCTQFGQHIGRWTCDLCGKVTSEHTYDDEPIAHDWNWSDEKYTCVCSVCGLENAKGASGQIVMEDLTAAYANGNYVIGYWNRGEVTFNPYVSLILYDAAEGENDELVLSGIEFTYLTVANDGICGLQFSQEAVAGAAAAAIKTAGYTGSYAVRISCVPLNSTDTLDYAITFETQTAE